MTIKMAFEKISVKALKRFSADIAATSLRFYCYRKHLLGREFEINSG
jgi:hypothetical protein